MRAKRGFTLVEVLIVVVILGVLAAIVTPIYGDVVGDSRKGAFISSLQTFAKACEHYAAKEGQYPEDGTSGEVPAGLEAYIDVYGFESPTPIGGVWDTEFNDSGMTAGVGVHFNGAEQPSDEFMEELDAMFDDGDLSTGLFRQADDASRFYYIIAE